MHAWMLLARNEANTINLIHLLTCMQKMDNCGVANTVVGVCGYSSRDCPEQTVAEFCRTHPSAKKFNGGLNGSPDGYSAVYVNALYWAPSSCQANVSSGGFCAYLATQKGKLLSI